MNKNKKVEIHCNKSIKFTPKYNECKSLKPSQLFSKEIINSEIFITEFDTGLPGCTLKAGTNIINWIFPGGQANKVGITFGSKVWQVNHIPIGIEGQNWYTAFFEVIKEKIPYNIYWEKVNSQIYTTKFDCGLAGLGLEVGTNVIDWIRPGGQANKAGIAAKCKICKVNDIHIGIDGRNWCKAFCEVIKGANPYKICWEKMSNKFPKKDQHVLAQWKEGKHVKKFPGIIEVINDDETCTIIFNGGGKRKSCPLYELSLRNKELFIFSAELTGLSVNHPQYPCMGVYLKQHDIINGKNIFKNKQTNVFLWWDSKDRKWCLGNKANIRSSAHRMTTCDQTDVGNPQNYTGQWKGNIDGQWVEVPNIKWNNNLKSIESIEFSSMDDPGFKVSPMTNIIESISPNGQAEKFGVCVGWRLLMVDGIYIRSDGENISECLSKVKNKIGKLYTLHFSKLQEQIQSPNPPNPDLFFYANNSKLEGGSIFDPDLSYSDCNSNQVEWLDHIKHVDTELLNRIEKGHFPEFTIPQYYRKGSLVGGHATAFLMVDDTIYKLVEDGRGRSEMFFYLSVQKALHSKETNLPHHIVTLQKLSKYIPKFYGVYALADSSYGSKRKTYICLNNITHTMVNSSMIDIKIGTQTYDPNASAKKCISQYFKYPFQKVMGFRITGMKVYDFITNDTKIYHKEFKRHTKIESPKNALRHFVGALDSDQYSFVLKNEKNKDTDSCRKNIVRLIIRKIIMKLENILDWFTKINKNYNFYASSILIAYEIQKKEQTSSTATTTTTTTTTTPTIKTTTTTTITTIATTTTTTATATITTSEIINLDVCLIDFGHVFFSKECKDDLGCIHGLTCLIRTFQQILETLN